MLKVNNKINYLVKFYFSKRNCSKEITIKDYEETSDIYYFDILMKTLNAKVNKFLKSLQAGRFKSFNNLYSVVARDHGSEIFSILKLHLRMRKIVFDRQPKSRFLSFSIIYCLM